ncbi:MAG: hypothetical protein Q8O90_02295, partial [Elusimicrobiota bacterium]|nr:hypothetical protein [Elusimicrobiota bacterium]
MKRLLTLALLAVVAIGTADASEGSLKILRSAAMSSADGVGMIPEPGFMELAGENKPANKVRNRVSLQATDGTKIDVDFTKDGYFATPVIKVYNTAFTGKEKVRAVLDNYYVNNYDTYNCSGNRPCGSYRKQELVLKADRVSLFSAQADKIATYIDLTGGGYFLAESLTVTVDGAKLIDPVSGSDKFRFRISYYVEIASEKASPFAVNSS